MTKKTEHIICNKEREIGIMATQIENIKDTTDKIDHKLDRLIDELPKIYATKSELKDLDAKLTAYNSLQDERSKNISGFIQNNWDKLLIVLSFAIYIMLRIYGLIK